MCNKLGTNFTADSAKSEVFNKVSKLNKMQLTNKMRSKKLKGRDYKWEGE